MPCGPTPTVTLCENRTEIALSSVRGGPARLRRGLATVTRKRFSVIHSSALPIIGVGPRIYNHAYACSRQLACQEVSLKCSRESPFHRNTLVFKFNLMFELQKCCHKVCGIYFTDQSKFSLKLCQKPDFIKYYFRPASSTLRNHRPRAPR